MLTGQSGVKYGLTVPKREAKKVLKKVNVFGGDDDSDDERQQVAKQIERQAQQKQTDKKVAKMQADALAEDPSVFDYDAHYDSVQQERERNQPIGQPERKSQYIQHLLDKTEARKREQDIIYERRLLKERQVEDHLFGDKERFVTAAYRKKLEEDRKWQEEEKLRDEIEAAQDVRKKGHMGDFYRNLLTRNVAFGAAQPSESSKPLQSNLGSERPVSRENNVANGKDSQHPGQSNLEPTDEEWERQRKAREAYEESQTASIGEKSLQQLANPERRDNASNDLRTEARTHQERKDESMEEQNPDEKQDQTQSKADKAAAAKERYLARKRKITES